ncbi:MAG: MBL fold metallo-hydrolase [Synergistaceae bacterium]|nr:MBL fold metallo-hydrolase [Synergistaceae bacterium]
MDIRRVVSCYMASNMYAVCEGEYAVLIDPCEKHIPRLKAEILIATHEHFDHISGVNFWKAKSGASFICSETCAKACKDPRRNLSRYFSAFCELQSWVKCDIPADPGDYSCEADEVYSGSMSFQWRGHEFTLFECPGHSQGGQCILLDGKILFSGDSLINGFKTSCNSPGGSLRKWREYSMPKIQSLSRNLVVYPGHLDSFILKDYDDGTRNFWTKEAGNVPID